MSKMRIRRVSKRKQNFVRTSPLMEIDTASLVAELKRRSLACLIATVNIGSKNLDEWHIETKGSILMLESIFFRVEDRLFPDKENGGEPVAR